MGFRNVVIKELAVYYPEKAVGNEYFEEHFGDTNVSSLMEHLGRVTRFLADENETSLTMAFEACHKVLKYAQMEPEEIDMIVFSSETPEYTAPTNALKLNHMLKAKNAQIVFDLNNNCIGMLTTLDLVSNYAKNNPSLKHVLVVGSLLISSVVSWQDPVTYPNFGDSAAAVILEITNENEERGFMGRAHYFTDSQYHDSIVMPACGFAKMYDKKLKNDDKRWNWTPFNFTFLSDNWAKLIRNNLADHGLTPADVDHFVFSQFSKPDSEDTLKKLSVDPTNYSYVGDKFGYTGTTSPIFGLRNAIRTKRVQKGSKVILCSVGAGYSMCSILYQF
ncbi:MAG TPA: ketoacyl-ACP synthase III [Methylomusa anaerophila]|uniref:3-oxoacyl-[acyl-carrier-protein] synthase 3 n=1 Tax=Methylomusa anaerophila TaxID=1930071 RepID=A0A348AGE4_9FIRM|nr:ketoacyl-ACP synthase III [Methylomusa anaerophila]BBB90142.1 3-oxoacyl-[acyl-carrier-protein] synthase 3 [Methylomusa anaerophila]HML88134.1 ketoacyl-ACP synthase III [Methylomusa anaerophila]